MPGSGKYLKRLEAFYAERASGALPAGAFAAENDATARLRALKEFREAKRRPAGLGPVPNESDWLPIGPAGVRFGQAGGEPVVSGRVSDLRISSDGQRVYVASANGGVWRSTDAGTNWEPLFDEKEFAPTKISVDSLACGAIALVERPAQPDLLYVGLGEPHAFEVLPYAGYLGAGMVSSPDGGTTWAPEAANPSLEGAGVFAIAVDLDNPQHALAATTQGVYRRAAAGTWAQEAVPAALAGSSSSVVSYRKGGAVCFAVVTRSGGAVHEWTPALPGPPATPAAWNALASLPGAATAERTTLAVSTSNPPVLYALVAKSVPNPNPDKLNSTHGLYRMTMGTNTWVTVDGLPNVLGNQGHYDIAVAVDPADENVVYVGGAFAGAGAAIYRAKVTAPAAGATHTSAAYEHIGDSVHPDVHALVFRPGSSDELWVGCDGGVFVSTHARTSGSSVFEDRNTGLATLTLMGLAQHPTEEAWAFCGAQDNGGIRYTGDEVWDLQLAGDGGDTVFDGSSGTRFLNGYVHHQVRRAAIDGSRFSASDVDLPSDTEGKTLFYPPIVQAPDDPKLVGVGADVPYLSTDFGGGWTALPAAPNVPAGARIRSLTFASNALLYAGWHDGHVTQYRKPPNGAWAPVDITAPASAGPAPNEVRTVTSIAIDRTDPSGESIFITLGGATGRGARVRRRTTAGWSDLAAGLVDLQHNKIITDDADPKRLYVAADLGVWQHEDFTDATKSWTTLSSNLPDAGVLDLDIFTQGTGAARFRLLRATTHGRGVFQLQLEPVRVDAAPMVADVELMLRANELDQRLRPARPDVPHPAQPGRRTRLDESPDIYVEVPDQNGRFSMPADRSPSLTALMSIRSAAQVLVAKPGAPVSTRVHVVVRNRGVRRIRDVRVSLMMGPEEKPLPAAYTNYAMAGGTLAEADGWVGVASVRAPEVWAGHHAVVTFEVSSDLLPAVTESAGKPYRILATLHHGDDAFPDHLPAATNDPIALVTACHKAALKRVTLVSGEGRTAAAGGTGLLLALSTTVLAERQLSAAAASLRGKVTTGATVTPVERRVLAMAEGGVEALRSGPAPGLTPPPSAPGIGTFALLGSLGFELPTYTSALMPGGTWVAEMLRRGTADPHMSKVVVPSTELALEFAKLSLPGATGTELQAAKGFTSGLLTGAAAGILLGPQLADLLAQDTGADWSPTSTSRGLRAVERLARNRYLQGTSAPVTAWLPPPDAVPARTWESFIKAIEATHRLPGTVDKGFLTDFDAGSWLTTGRMQSGYQLLLDDARAENWGFWGWFFAISPILVMPSVAFAFARTLPHAKAFVEGGDLGERAFLEAIALSEGLGALMPFAYSMALWSKFGDHTDAFVESLIMGLGRLGVSIAALASSGEEDQSPTTRWAGFFLPLAVADAYATLRAILDPDVHPANGKIFALQAAPGATSLMTLGWLGLARGITGDEPTTTKSDWTFWLTTILGGLVTLAAVGLPTASALSHGGGWRSWFLRRTGDLPLLSSVSALGTEPLTPTAAARVYPQDQLWAAPGNPAELDKLAYPAGMRPVLRFWWEGQGELSVKFGEATLTFRSSTGDQVVDLPAPPTAVAIARRLETSVDKLKTEVVTPLLGDVPLPAPRSLADLGDTALAENADALRDHFVRVPTTKTQALTLRQSPRAEQAQLAGHVAANQDRYVVVPAVNARNEADTGLLDAADLGALFVLAAAPSLGTVTANPIADLADPSVKEVMQVFRRWNLDERRLDEWRSLVTGHSAMAAGPLPPADLTRPVDGRNQNVMIRPQAAGYQPQPKGRDVAEALGWLPLWRAWLAKAANAAANLGSEDDAGNPEISLPGQGTRRVKNRELTEGVSFLLDLGVV